MAGVHRFEDLKAWQAARLLSREVFGICQLAALRKDYSLRNQICRAAISAMANIAEGFSRESHREFERVYGYAADAGHLLEDLPVISGVRKRGPLTRGLIPKSDFIES